MPLINSLCQNLSCSVLRCPALISIRGEQVSFQYEGIKESPSWKMSSFNFSGESVEVESGRVSWW